MSQELVLSLARQGLIVALLLSLPALGVGMVVGVAISIFQATTQIQEQTLTFVPKIIAVLLAMLLFSGWMLNTILNFTQNIFGNLPGMIR
ncbi:MAG: flagellar biosynthesis protein FliQ [Clostridia bacterium]|nr:MAG: flagellar biosynthesis protein FliQ [Clostridia bacterium]